MILVSVQQILSVHKISYIYITIMVIYSDAYLVTVEQRLDNHQVSPSLHHLRIDNNQYHNNRLAWSPSTAISINMFLQKVTITLAMSVNELIILIGIVVVLSFLRAPRSFLGKALHKLLLYSLCHRRLTQGPQSKISRHTYPTWPTQETQLPTQVHLFNISRKQS